LKSVIKCGQHSHDLIKYLAFITKKKAIKITKETFGSAINGENTVRASDGHYQKSAHSLAARKVHIRKSCELLHLYVCVCVWMQQIPAHRWPAPASSYIRFA